MTRGSYLIARPRLAILLAVIMVSGPLLIGTPAVASAPFSIIDNGTVQLGVHAEGHLNVPGGTPSSGTGTTDVGLRFVPTNAEATSPFCLCEGWGAADATSGVAGYANEDEGGAFNITPISTTSTASTVVSVVEIGDVELGAVLRVTHDYHPSPATPNLYEVTVTIENMSGNPIDARYRRVMDWDVEPTPTSEFVTIETGTSSNLLFASDDGFATANPLGAQTGTPGDAVDRGPGDLGALFDFGFGSVLPGESVTFKTYYGAAATESEALAALAAVTAEVYSLGQPNTEDGQPPTVGAPNTFVFGFAGVGGEPVFPSAQDDSATTAQNTPVNIGVLANDSNPNEGPFTVNNLTQPENGSAVVLEDQTVTYTPNPGFSGIDTFTYTANDGQFDSNVATVTVTVTGAANQPPVAMDDSATTSEDTPVTIQVLANDDDPDEDQLSISNLTQPENGSADLQQNGVPYVLYTPNEGFSGTDTFTYTANDGELDSNVATVTVTVTEGEVVTCEVEASEGCTATTDDGVTSPDNPISVVMTVPAGQPAGVYSIREIDQTVPKPAGAFEWFAPEGATEIFIEVSCDESQCPRLRNRRLDLQLTVIKENPDGTVKTLLPCVQGRRGQIVNPPPCVFSVIRDLAGSGDLIWTVKVLGGDPKAGGAR